MVKKIAAPSKKVAGTSAPVAPAKKSPAAKAAGAKAPVSKTPVSKTPVSKAAAAKAPAVKAGPAKKAPPAKTPVSKAAAAKAPAVKAAPAKKEPAAKTPVSKAAAAKAPAAKAPAAKTPAVKTTTPPIPPKQSSVKDAVKETATASASAKKETPPAAAPASEAVAPKRTTAAARKAAAAAVPALTLPPVKGEGKDGIKYTKDFDAKFLANQRKLLLEARESLTGQAVRLEDEANSLIDDEMGDVQFDDESGEGDTMVVERERDLFLSARARQDIAEIDGALRRLEIGSYGYSVVSYKPIPRERLEAIPWATELTEEKVGGIGRR